MITEEVIKDLIHGGWYFRIDSLQGNDYITVIKGDKNKILGLYTDDAWKIIVNLNGAVFYPEDDF